MQPVTRQSIFAQAAKKLRQDFLELVSVPHASLRGGEAERLIRSFLAAHIPKRFAVGAGFVIDTRDAVSPQCDVIVYDALNCPLYRASEDAAIIPSNNVAAVIEVKSSLTKERLLDAAEKIAAVKRLARVRVHEDSGPSMDQAMGCVFAFESDLALPTLASHFHQSFRTIPLFQHIDLIVVLDRGIITLGARVPAVPGWNLMFAQGFGGTVAEGTHFAIATQELGDNTLNAFLRLLLAQLTLFRGLVDHPGFNWSTTLPEGKTMLHYLTSVTSETDPGLRKQRLEAYASLAKREFATNPLPPDLEALTKTRTPRKGTSQKKRK